MAAGHGDPDEQLVGVPEHRADLDGPVDRFGAVELGEPAGEYVPAFGDLAADPSPQVGVEGERGGRQQGGRRLDPVHCGEAADEVVERGSRVVGTGGHGEQQADGAEQRTRCGGVDPGD